MVEHDAQWLLSPANVRNRNHAIAVSFALLESELTRQITPSCDDTPTPSRLYFEYMQTTPNTLGRCHGNGETRIGDE